MPKGTHPNSRRNLEKRNLKRSNRNRKLVSLTPETIAFAESISGGSVSDGVDGLFSRLPLFYRVKLALEQVAAGKAIAPEIIDALILELDELEIDRVYEEAVAEGVIVCPGADGEASAWIV